MTTSLLLLSIFSFASYFYIIWFWYLWLIPILAFLIFFIYNISWFSFKHKTNSILQNYALFFVRIVVQFWLFLLFKFFDVGTMRSMLSIISINILFWFLSYVFKYEDWKKIAQFGYYASIILALLYSLWNYGIEMSLDLLFYMWILTFAIVGFIVFVFPIIYEVEDYLNYQFLVLALWSVWILLFKQIDNIYIFLLITVFALGAIYIFIFRILSNKPPTESQIKEISVRRILAWERVLKEVNKNREFSKKLYSFVSGFPNFVKYWFEFANSLVILILIYLYFQNALSLAWSTEQIFYRLITVWFIVNVYLLKRINYTSTIQRLLTFLVINFAIYISLFSAFWWNIWTIVFLGIVRNILSTTMVFHIHKTKIGEYLRKVDYLFWIFTTMLALVVNIVLLFHTDLARWLLFPIILLYVWIQWISLYYSIKYINKIKELTEEEQED